MKYRFKLVKDSQTMTITTPEGIEDYYTALSTLDYLKPYEIIDQETIHDHQPRRKGLFSLW